MNSVAGALERLNSNILGFHRVNLRSDKCRSKVELQDTTDTIRRLMVAINQVISPAPNLATTIVKDDSELNKLQITETEKGEFFELIESFLKDPSVIFDEKGLLKPLVKNTLDGIKALCSSLKLLSSGLSDLNDQERRCQDSERPKDDFIGAKTTLKSFSNSMAIIARNYLQNFVDMMQGLSSANSIGARHHTIPNTFPA